MSPLPVVLGLVFCTYSFLLCYFSSKETIVSGYSLTSRV